MNEFIGVTVVLVIVLAVLVFFVVRLTNYWKKYHLVRHERARLSTVFPTLKSGDILLFIAHTHGLTNSLGTNDLFTHCGMVVRTGDRLLVSEATVDTLMPDPQSDGEIAIPEHATLTPLLARLKHYAGATYLMRLSRRLDAGREAILLERTREELPYPTMKYMLLALVGVQRHWRARHCMQHVAWLLDEMAMTPLPLREEGRSLLDSGFFGSSRAVSTLPGEDLGDGYSYAPPVEILYDIDAR